MHSRRSARETVASLARFAVVGTATTVVYALLYVAAVAVLPPLAANTVAMVLSTIISTEWHRAWTYRSPNRGLRVHLRAGLITTVTYATTSSALVILEAVRPGAGTAAQVAVLVLATTLAGLIRFAVLRAWVFRHGDAAPRTIDLSTRSSGADRESSTPGTDLVPAP